MVTISDRTSVLQGALFYYGRLLGNGTQALRQVQKALAAEPIERVLDFGCGTGGFCQAVPGPYLGIDLDPHYLAFARWRWGSTDRRFEALSLETLPAVESFEKAMLINCVHHLSDDAAQQILGELARRVRRRLVVVDADPSRSNWLQSWLLAHDRGEYIRRPEQIRALLARHFTVIDEWIFPNNLHTVVQIVFVCEPKT